VKNEDHCLGPVSNLFWLDDIKRFRTGFYLKIRIVRPTKIATFWPTNGNHFCVTPNDCRRQTLVFKQVKPSWRPPIWLPPQTSGLDPPLYLGVSETARFVCTAQTRIIALGHGLVVSFLCGKNIVLIPNFVTKKFEQTVFQGFASDKGYCTYYTTVDITSF